MGFSIYVGGLVLGRRVDSFFLEIGRMVESVGIDVVRWIDVVYKFIEGFLIIFIF